MKQVVVETDGVIHAGLAYWSDRTIPGRWIYPEWHSQGEALDLMVASPELTESDNARLSACWKNKS